MKSTRVILAVGAHPDDIEFGCGATMAKLASEGHTLYFVVATSGNRGSRSQTIKAGQLIKSRKSEQLEAAKLLGAKEVIFLDYPDGELTADLEFKESIVKLIRKLKPDVVFTHDPNWFYREDPDGSYINHSDHRECGKAVLDAIYPLSRDLLSFPDHLTQGLTPHIVKELYLYFPQTANHYIDVSKFIDQKFTAIFAHRSQIDNHQDVEDRFRKRLAKYGRQVKAKYAEAFVRLTLR